jgi:AhpD family alkylhydroperoxidase
MAAAWAMLRESLLCGNGRRRDREIVAAAVSVANQCPFCVDSHTMMLHATGDHRLAEVIMRGGIPDDPADARLFAWAIATRTPGSPDLAEPPFPSSVAPGMIGTALAFHFVNRTVSALLTDEVLPGNLQRSRTVRSLSGHAFGRSVRRELRPGASLPLLDERGPAPHWAVDVPVGAAYAALCHASRAGGALLGRDARFAVLDVVDSWDGSHPPLGGGWLAAAVAPVRAEDRAGARLALLAALAPYRITGADVAAWRVGRRADADTQADTQADADLVRLIAFGAFAAVERVEVAVTIPEAERR